MSLAWSTAVRLLTVLRFSSRLPRPRFRRRLSPPSPRRAGRGGLRRVRQGLGAWRRDEPVRRVRAWRTPAAPTRRSSRTTTREPSSARRRRRTSGCSSPRPPAVTIASTVPFTALDAPATCTSSRPERSCSDRSSRCRRTTGPYASRPARRPSGEGSPALPRRPRVPGTPRDHGQGRVPAGRERRHARGLPAGRRRERDATPWPREALKAQAVAARSYALASLVKGKPFDLYSDVRSQVYRGVAGETAQTTAAVRATSGRGRPLRRQARDDLLLLDLGRKDRQRG